LAKKYLQTKSKFKANYCPWFSPYLRYSQ